MRSPVEVREKAAGSAVIAFTADELLVINNCLNELANGLDLEDDEVSIRTGAPREQVQSLLKQVNQLLNEMGP